MELDLKYGTGTIKVHIPESAQARVLEPNHLDPVDTVEQALSPHEEGPRSRRGAAVL